MVGMVTVWSRDPVLQIKELIVSSKVQNSYTEVDSPTGVQDR